MFTTNSKHYTDKHNNIMDDLLFTYAECHPDEIQADGKGNYGAVDLCGLEMLQHLCDCDLIEEVVE